MIRKCFIAIAGAVAALVAPAHLGAQGAAPAKAPTMTTAKATQGLDKTMPTQQPTSGAAEEPKVSASTIMTVTIPKKVMADGKPLAPGAYVLRLTDETGSPVVGQTTSEARWVEFLQGGQVKGRELATVLTTSEAKTIAKQALPASGGAKVENLMGNDYLRVWINKGGTNYLVHLAS